MAFLKKSILVTGDVIVDHHIYLGERATPDDEIDKIGSQEEKVSGGAGLVFHILQQISYYREQIENSNHYDAKFGLDQTIFEHLPACLHAFALWKPFSYKNNLRVWRIEKFLGYGNYCRPFFPLAEYAIQDLNLNPKVLLLDDAGLGFRHNTQKLAWSNLSSPEQANSIDYIILKMAKPVAQGDLWRLLSSKFSDKLITVISINDIRREQVRVSKGISWERAAMDLSEELCFNSAIHRLMLSRHLIINFGSEGALHVDSQKSIRRFRLIFDPANLELEWRDQNRIQGHGLGFMSCFCAAIADRLLQPNETDPIFSGIVGGLSAMRTMHQNGHGVVGDGSPQFPFAKVANDVIKPSHTYAEIEIPNLETATVNDRKNWTIMAAKAQGSGENGLPMYGIGRRVALLGTKALVDIPFARFGKLFTVDLEEIESMHNIRNLIINYEKNKTSTSPLSLAVFGQPGSGKSFGIKQITRGILGEKAPILEFNLSQFREPDELISAFHQVRDKVLLGITPVVFWDEFDCDELKWLQYMLAPMQDGIFQDGQIAHPLGKCVFVFAGGTSYEMEHFAPKEDDVSIWQQFKQKKGPDFVSRLSGYLNVLGPNRKMSSNNKLMDQQSDRCFPVRRALLIRSMLDLSENAPLDIDRGILSALLEIDQYRHGARSLEKIITQLKKADNAAIRRSDLPPASLLDLYVDSKTFMEIVNRDLTFNILADELAPYIHEFYRELGRKEDWLKYRPDMDKDFKYLAADYQDDNRAAAERIPKVLDLVGLYEVPESNSGSDTLEEISEIIERNIELLAEAEHDGWMDHKLRNGWVYGEKRDEGLKIHDCLVPYEKLNDKDREKDRNSVRRYLKILKNAKYKIVTNPENVR